MTIKAGHFSHDIILVYFSELLNRLKKTNKKLFSHWRLEPVYPWAEFGVPSLNANLRLKLAWSVW